MTTDNGVELTAAQVIAMYPASVVRGTDAHWPAVAIQWMQQAEAEIERLRAQPAAQPERPFDEDGFGDWWNEEIVGLLPDGCLRMNHVEAAARWGWKAALEGAQPAAQEK